MKFKAHSVILDDIIVFKPIFVQYTMFGVDIPYPGLFPYPGFLYFFGNVKELLKDFIPRLTYPAIYTFCG